MTTKDRIERILQTSRQARNDDRFLLVQLMQEYGMNLSYQQIEKFRDMPSMESIRRTRQKIQQEGKYPADQKVRKGRYAKSLITQQRMPTTKADKVQPLLEQRAIPWMED